MMDTGFETPLHPRKKPSKNIDTFKIGHINNMDYDYRSSCFIKAGQSYGVGFNQPVGSKTPRKGNAIPKGKVEALSLYPKDY